jgi:hypothetical protein
MIGKIEIYSNYDNPNRELIYEGNNTIVDGAGEIFADIMCAHTSLSGISDLSSILDTSNYTIQAISFGKDAAGYQRHAHEVSTRKGYGAYNPAAGNGIQPRTVLIQPDITVSSYEPSSFGKFLPSFVTPRQTQLELNTLTSGTFTNPSQTSNFDLSLIASGITNIGHNLNTLAYASDLKDDDSISESGLAGLFGCYPAGSGTGGTSAVVVSSEEGVRVGAAGWSDVIYSGTYNGLFNQVSSMDTSGFVNFVGSSTVDPQLAAGFSGLTVSANLTAGSPNHLSSTGELAYKVVIGSGDLGLCNLYGGIYNLGLWSMDLCKALKNNNPPFAFHPITNEKRYKLFSKKSLLDNICRTKDSATAGAFNYEDLTLIWRLFFV